MAMVSPLSQLPSGALAPAQQRALAAARAGRPARTMCPPHRAIHLHFHPDWLVDGLPVIERLARSGRYCSQFETGISNGSFSPEAGGQRWQWEHDRFAGAYDATPAAQRPVYGAVDLAGLAALQEANTRHPALSDYGAAPRFGSAYLQLHPALAARSSFCDPDSCWQPVHTGGWEHIDWADLQCLRLSDPLDHYVEAQVHGELRLARDVAAVVLDPSFADTAIAHAALRTGVPLRYHAGYRLGSEHEAAAEAYRGAEVAAVLRQLWTRDPTALTPARLGQAQAEGRWDRQLLKKAWHCVARLGQAAL